MQGMAGSLHEPQGNMTCVFHVRRNGEPTNATTKIRWGGLKAGPKCIKIFKESSGGSGQKIQGPSHDG